MGVRLKQMAIYRSIKTDLETLKLDPGICHSSPPTIQLELISS